MPCSSVVGLQWGDEAKGKIVDILTEEHDFVVRYNGGANAGHTVVKDGKTFKLSLLPTGVICPHITSVIGNGVVVYPPRFAEEVDGLKKAGVGVGENLLVSNHAHVIFPYHMEEEKLIEVAATTQAIGTTKRGIGPCYQDKLGRLNGVRVEELLHPDHLRTRLRAIVAHKNRILVALGGQPFDADSLADEYVAHGDRLRPARPGHDPSVARRPSTRASASSSRPPKGSLLDVDHGTYPYVTSSNSSVAGIWAG